MKNKTLDEIKKSLVAKLTEKYKYCGLADGDTMAMLNSGAEDESLIITLEDRSGPFAKQQPKET